MRLECFVGLFINRNATDDPVHTRSAGDSNHPCVCFEDRPLGHNVPPNVVGICIVANHVLHSSSDGFTILFVDVDLIDSESSNSLRSGSLSIVFACVFFANEC